MTQPKEKPPDAQLRRTKPYKQHLLERLKTPKDAAAYLEAALADYPNEPETIGRAMQDICEAFNLPLGVSLVASSAPVEGERCGTHCGHPLIHVENGVCRYPVTFSRMCGHRCDFSRPAPEPIKVQTSASGRRFVDVDAVIRNRLAQAKEPRPVSEAADGDSQVFYPGIVDQKTLSACLGTADLIIREPKPERIERFQRTKATLIAQIKAHPMSFDEWNREHNPELTKE